MGSPGLTSGLGFGKKTCGPQPVLGDAGCRTLTINPAYSSWLGKGGIAFCTSHKVPLLTWSAQQELEKLDLEYQRISLPPSKMQGIRSPAEKCCGGVALPSGGSFALGVLVRMFIQLVSVRKARKGLMPESNGAMFPTPQVDDSLPAKFWSHSSCMRLLCLSSKGGFWGTYSLGLDPREHSRHSGTSEP